ncbi:MAG: CHAT domain-containing protein [Anaerolineales bacterium]|nr:MAG: CHAT domain-containing protein [Anaerolineales bacterium]
MWHIHPTENWIGDVVGFLNEHQLSIKDSKFMIAFFSSMDNEFVDYFRHNKNQISSFSGKSFHIFTPLIYEGNVIPDEDWRYMRREFRDFVGIPINTDPTFVFFSLDNLGHNKYEPKFFAGFTCSSFSNFPNKMKNVIDSCIEMDDPHPLARKLSEIFLSENIIPRDRINYEFKATITRAIAEKSKFTSILFLAADPTDASRLRLGEEFREIQEKLKLAQLRKRFKLELPQLSIRPADISQALLDTEPQIVHFSGHGASNGALCFENQTGQIQFVEPDALAALFQQFSRHVNCVLLNACYSETQAKAIAKHIQYVIGMNQAIGDKAAIAFAIGFYQALGAGRTIDDAYKLGCIQIRLQGISEHLTPVLFRGSTSQGDISSIIEVIEKVDLSDEVLEKLSRDEYSNVRLAVAKNPNSSNRILEKLADDPNDDIKIAVLSHSNCPPEVLIRYIQHENPKFRKSISKRHNVPQKVSDILVEKKRQALDKHVFVNGICKRCGCTPAFVEHFESDCNDYTHNNAA